MNNVKETIDVFSCEIFLDAGTKIESDSIIPFFDSLMAKDTLKISVSIDDTEPYSFVIEEKEDLTDLFEQNEHIDDDSKTVIKIEIIKNHANSINIYNLDCFIKYIEHLSLKQVLSVFSRFKGTTNKVLLNFREHETAIFSTNNFCTTQSNKEISNFTKQERIENLNLVTNTSGISTFNFIPEDFKVNDCTDELSKLKAIFNKIATFLSIAFIADWSELNDDELHFKILGYKKIDISISIIQEIKNVDVFFKVYQWIFENGNGSIEDKLGIARNIISRYLKYTHQNLILDEDAYSSIITSYKIYLKDNVEKYIETKNKVAELNTEITTKVQEMNQLISSNFKNNNITLLTYFISLFIFNSVAFKQTTVFTTHTFVISIAVLIISTAYLFLTAKQLKKEIKVNIRYFFAIKSIYKDFFDPAELNKIFNKRHFSYNLHQIQQTFQLYMKAWIVEIALLFAVSILLTYGTEIKTIISSYIKMIVIN